ncbi:hypothetical protein ABPG72_021676 [Tetrahymena utriculariae]
MGCAEFCAILSFVGTIFLCILGIIVASGTKFIDWDLGNHRDSTKSSLFITAALYFVFFLLSMVYKWRKDKRLAEEAASKAVGRRRLISGDDDGDSQSNQPNQIRSNNYAIN